jgi:hypothetical protein
MRAATVPVPGLLPKDRTNPGTAFEVVGIDFAGPVKYKKTTKLNAAAPKFEPRPSRAAGEAARIRIQEMAEEDDI